MSRFWNFIEKSVMEVKPDTLFLKKLNATLSDYLIFGGYPEVAKSADAKEEKSDLLKNIYTTYIGKDITACLV